MDAPEYSDKGWSCPMNLRQLETLPLAVAAVQTDVQKLQLALSQCLSSGQHCHTELFSHVSCQQTAKSL